ncbi:MAG: thioredoxin family protein [Candidatus Micrarchaeia archaeon]|jgi:thiol-disulfide isomerase/thioredoxin
MRVLKFGAVWCSGCLIMKPRWQELEKDNPWLKNEYYDYDKDKEIVNKYKVNDKLPTFVFLDKNNKEFLRLHGEISKEKLQKILEENKKR